MDEREGLVELEEICGLVGFVGDAVTALFKTLPEGYEKYGALRPTVGKINFKRIGEDDECSFALHYFPTGKHRERIGRDYFGSIAIINTRDKTWKSYCDYCGESEGECVLPEQLIDDTARVMDVLGLRRVDSTSQVFNFCRKSREQR